MPKKEIPHHLPKQTFQFIGACILLIGAWLLVLMWLTVFTEEVLAPWDARDIAPPPTTTWQATLDDFFGARPGVWLPSMFVLAACVTTFLWQIRKVGWRSIVPLRLAVSALIYAILLIAIAIATLRLPDLWLGGPPWQTAIGYHRTWLAGITLTVLTTAWLWRQATWQFANDSST
ncbi:MAG: hypothetical protein GY759_14135 [Chloroflexi bacterium]|nr:hypothetical protein [Chloroflexota bacterium]